MNSLIVYAHPWDGSFSHSVKERVQGLLAKQGKKVDLIDLNADKFDPVMHNADLRVFSKGGYADPLAKHYVERLHQADEVILIFPIWWYGEPAILKGFFDKVFLKGTTYVQNDYQVQGMLRINKGAVLTTGAIDKETFRQLGDPIQNTLIQGTLGLVGIRNVTWIHCPGVQNEENRLRYLEEIDNYFK